MKKVLVALLIVPVAWSNVAFSQVADVELKTVAITVSDMEQALAFYTELLPFEKESDIEVDGPSYERLFGLFGLRVRVVTLRLGEEQIELVQVLAPDAGRPIPVDSRSNDHWFQHIAIIVSDMDRAYLHLRAHDVTHASTGPQTLPDWNPAAGGIRAFYFKDPDGNVLEILEFPPGKGAPRWHRESGGLFLGIDHTAIVIGDTETSLGFYRDVLGFEVTGESENYGIEQERLNNVFGARLRITGLRPPGGGMAIEFLEYLAPSTGRPMPRDTNMSDLWHWHVRLASDGLPSIFGSVKQRGDRLVSPGIQILPDGRLGFGEGFMVRGPDGHAVLLGK